MSRAPPEAIMNEPGTVSADLFADREVPVDAERDLVRALAAAGVDARAKVLPPRRGP